MTAYYKSEIMTIARKLSQNKWSHKITINIYYYITCMTCLYRSDRGNKNIHEYREFFLENKNIQSHEKLNLHFFVTLFKCDVTYIIQLIILCCIISVLSMFGVALFAHLPNWEMVYDTSIVLWIKIIFVNYFLIYTSWELIGFLPNLSICVSHRISHRVSHRVSPCFVLFQMNMWNITNKQTNNKQANKRMG